MAKAKKPETNDGSDFDEAFEASLETAQKKYPDNVFTGGEESMRYICLPMPALAPRVLFQQEGFPMGRFFLLDGPKESFKSSLGYEFIHWHRKMGGKGQIIEVEDKKSPDLGLSINEWDHRAFATHFCDTMQGWNEALTYWIHEFIKIMDGDPKSPKSKPGLGRLFPICFLVDSIMAAVGDDLMETIKKEGHSERHFATDANLLSEFLKAFTKWITKYPFSVIGVNHLKPTQDKRGFALRHMPGGKAPEYHATTDIEVNKLKEEKLAKHEYARLRLRTQKNSSAPKSEIVVDVIWYIDVDHPTEDGECLQRTYFDWDAASIRCILNRMEEAGADTKRRLKELVDLRSVNEARVASPVLGISTDSPCDWREAGQILEAKIQQDKEFRDLLYPLMGVRRRHLFTKGVPYDEQMLTARDEAKRAQMLREALIRQTPLDTAALDEAADGGGNLEIN